MRISLLRISLLRFFKTFHIYLANAIIVFFILLLRFYVYFANAILWLMQIFDFYISLVRFFGLTWLMQILANAIFFQNQKSH